MKKLILGISLILVFASCEEEKMCNCEYVSYTASPYTDYKWEVDYKSTWDTTCENELLSESTYYDVDGDPWYSAVQIECK